VHNLIGSDNLKVKEKMTGRILRTDHAAVPHIHCHHAHRGDGLGIKAYIVWTLQMDLSRWHETATLVWPCLRNKKTSGMCMYSC
jgi:hypothetical protein